MAQRSYGIVSRHPLSVTSQGKSSLAVRIDKAYIHLEPTDDISATLQTHEEEQEPWLGQLHQICFRPSPGLIEFTQFWSTTPADCTSSGAKSRIITMISGGPIWAWTARQRHPNKSN